MKRRVLTASLVGAMLLGGAAVAQQDLRQQEQEEYEQQPGMGGAGEQGQRQPMQGQAAARGAAENDKQAAFANPRQAFEVSGTLIEQSGRDLTLARPNLPPIQLRVEDQTTLSFPGQRITPDNLAELPIGSEVRARFQVVGDDVIALSVDHAGQKKGMQPQQQPQQQRR